MRLGARLSIWTATVVLAAAMAVSAQKPEVIVGDIAFPNRVWGEQKISFDVTNTTDWIKYAVVETEVSFDESYVKPHRLRQTSFVLDPGTNAISPVMEIPPNYGRLTLWVRVYEVIDTLDDLSLGTLLFEQPFNLRFHAPEAVLPYFQERLSMPPLVGEHGVFDNEFSRLLLVLAQERKTVPQIAELCSTTEDYVRLRARELVSTAYLRRVENDPEGREFEPNIPVITHAYAARGRELADSMSEKLAVILGDNLGSRRALIDSLKQNLGFSGDSGSFFEGGTLLYRPYPLVAGLYFWYFLGQRFVSGGEPLEILKGTDPCMPHLGAYSYLVQGGDYYIGTNFFNASFTNDGYNAHYSDSIPEIVCYPNVERKKTREQETDWKYGGGFKGESFLYDTTFVNPMLRHLDVGVDEVVRDGIAELRAINSEYLGAADVALGARYWFFNLLVTRTLDRMIKAGSLIRTSDGQFHFVEKKKS
jgi:hypothetical protein